MHINNHLLHACTEGWSYTGQWLFITQSVPRDKVKVSEQLLIPSQRLQMFMSELYTDRQPCWI